MQIFESVPNISEGRDQAKIDQLVAIVLSVKNIKFLDYSSDPDHNRSVFTFLGTAESIVEANYQLVEKAQEILNIDEHQGIHPRLGVVDVIPIIPLLGVPMDTAIELAHQLGTKIKKNLEIPVYYYENAAIDEKKRNLANIRREKYNIERHPRAGAICIGARGFLLAYNINLETTDLQIAQKIASKIRERDGGLPYVKALGLYLESKKCAQVSMNLTNPLVTDMKQVYQTVIRLTGEFDTKIKAEEIIGLEPQKVIIEAQAFKKELIKNADIEKS